MAHREHCTAGTPSAAQTMGARTEHVQLARADGPSPHGAVEWIEHLGDQNHLHVRIGEHRLVVLVDPQSDLRVGDRVEVEFKEPLFFDAAGARLETSYQQSE